MKDPLSTIKGKASFRTQGVFLDCHVPVLVFQANAFKHITIKYRVTRADFIALAGGWSIQKENPLGYFDNPKLTQLVYGVSRNILFKSLNRLLRLRMIEVDKRQKNHRRFKLTELGEQCIKAFTQFYNFSLYLWANS